MENRIRVGAVSYLNTKPLLYGIEKSPIMDQISLELDYPAEVARKLLNNQLDIGLVPVAVLPKMKTCFIDSDYCIGANGPVGSVAIFSDVPLEKVETLLLDYQSKTSVALARILCKHFYHVSPNFKDAYPGYTKDISGNVAGVVIGDRAFEQKKVSVYEYDLAEAWTNMTGLPFVFAAWVSNKKLPELFVDAFDLANEWGLNHLEDVIAENPGVNYDLKEYFTKNISYRFDESKRKGLALFLKYLKEEGSEPLKMDTMNNETAFILPGE